MFFKELNENNIQLIIHLFIETFNAEPWNDHWQESTVNKRLEELVQTPDFAGLLLFKEERLVGFILGNQEQYYDGRIFVIKEFCIDQHCQGEGLGSILLEEFEKRIFKEDIKSILLMTLRTPHTKKFYEKNGYCIDDELIMMRKMK